MKTQVHKDLLPADGLASLVRHKELIMEETVGKVSVRLMQATLQAVARLDRHEPSRRVLKPAVFALARSALKALARKKGKPSDTLMLLQPVTLLSWRSDHGQRPC